MLANGRGSAITGEFMIETFNHLFLLGRPAAGKSEFIDFMQKTPPNERAEAYHIGNFSIMDDFFWLWEKFMEDDMWEEAGYERIWSVKQNGNYSVRRDKFQLYDIMFAKFNHEIGNIVTNENFYDNNTIVIEFSRGRDKAYREALQRISENILKKAAILYIDVDFDESWRRNVARYKEKLKSSSLSHMAPRETMEYFYKTDDWHAITKNKRSGFLTINNIDIPFVTMNNTPELKERDALAKRYSPYLDELFDITFKQP